MKVVGEEYFNSRQQILEGSLKIPSLPNCSIWCYDVHDGKMVYELTQYSKWNRSGTPNILCYCYKGEGLKANHVCEMLTTLDYSHWWCQSEVKWDAKNPMSQDADKHCDWADLENNGVTHFGVKPEQFPIDSIRFDTFHLTCAIL